MPLLLLLTWSFRSLLLVVSTLAWWLRGPKLPISMLAVEVRDRLSKNYARDWSYGP
ncbi:hypothetical protein NST94_17165 [Paenibacillus sp. FSL H8-0282]|uniref:hypothetical protein n=1 Tax=Paenibacillus sp. FSL H8-0282 TaxID=2954741 RepID=UPI0030D76709